VASKITGKYPLAWQKELVMDVSKTGDRPPLICISTLTAACLAFRRVKFHPDKIRAMSSARRHIRDNSSDD